MNYLLSAKGGDVTSWRAVEDFAAAYRHAMIRLASSDRNGSTETVLSGVNASLASALSIHHELVTRLQARIEEASSASPSKLKKLARDFYTDLYGYFDHFRSAPAFYQLSTAFLQQACAAIAGHSREQLGLFSRHLPELTLIAAGPAGRREYSPLSPLQILLVHDEATASRLQTIKLYCETLHAGFEEAGFLIDPVVTPRNPAWRGSLPEWEERCAQGVRSRSDNQLIDLCRLVDLSPLYPDDNSAAELKRISSVVLNGSRPALINLIERMKTLSNGMGIMGRLKLEKSGDERGLFKLLDHGLLPFSAALTALALFKKCDISGNCERIIDLLKRRELDVEMSERMLATWHILQDLRLQREKQQHYEGHTAASSLNLNPENLPPEQLQSLKDSLESVAVIQRHVEIIFSGMGE